jgi:two-component system, NarL family, sensor histidine kinase LiaS
VNNERVTLAQELHDGIAQDLVVLGFSIDQVISKCQDAELKNSLRQIRFTTTELIEKVRGQMHELRSSAPLVTPNGQVDTMFETLRIVQEVLRNVEKHSGASTLDIHISDNGDGGVSRKEGSFGLAGLQERVQKLNGEITIASDQQGTRIGVRIPLDR